MPKITRRDFLALSALGTGSALLTACGLNPAPKLSGLPPITTAVGPTLPAATDQPTSAPIAGGKGGKKATPGANQKGKSTPATPAAPANGDFIARPITGRPTSTSVTANVVPASVMTVYYEYGMASGAYTAQTVPQSAAAGEPLETLISELQPNTRYFYRLRYGPNADIERSFVTQRAPGSTFTFALQGDSHPERLGKEFSPDLYTITLRQAATDQPDFYLTAGDDFSVDAIQTVNADTVRALYINQRKWLCQTGAPVFLVNGNHEQAAMANLNGTANNVAVWAQTARNAYYPQPAPDIFYSGDATSARDIGPLRDYYAFAWGDALFVILDQYWHSPVTVDNQFGAGRDQKGQRDLWQITIGDAQYQWFRQTLASSQAKYKFVFSHHVLGTQRGGIDVADKFEWGDTANLAAHRPGWDKTIHQVMAENHVTIYFQGHDHIFVRQELDGVIYQTLPEPADPNYSLFNANAYRSGDKLPNTGYVRVKVAPAGVTVDYVRTYLPQAEKSGHTSGEVAFTYTVS